MLLVQRDAGLPELFAAISDVAGGKRAEPKLGKFMHWFAGRVAMRWVRVISTSRSTDVWSACSTRLNDVLSHGLMALAQVGALALCRKARTP